ncbi:LssY C-terminal domain-containing protein [Rothia sp. CCM 9417]|uniref:LssY C-terminal domain-containing protein n=1 Tax=unclassified Rothia (in: high G+C Gram-positive bacteria) TaxID=2689056 RepID=UPI003ACD6B8F
MNSDPNYPRYRGNTSPEKIKSYLQFQADRRVFSGALDKLYFIGAGLASIWLAIVALIEASTHSWWAIPLIIVFWGICAYFTLPRFHRIMTDIYVPSYFIGRARTGDGLLGDPINIGIRGEEADIHRAMTQAGWHQAEPVTLASSWRIIRNTLTRTPYPTAPVSPLYLFNRKEDFAYQQEVDGSPQKRHHVRFWKAPQGWKLPGGASVDWLAGATFDRAVGLSLFTLQVTHKIDADTDKERDYVVETVAYCNPQTQVEVIKDFSTGYHSRNGGGDDILTDGNLPILELAQLQPSPAENSDLSPEKLRGHRPAWELVQEAPPSVWVAALFVGILAMFQLGINLWQISRGDFLSLENSLTGDELAHISNAMTITQWTLSGLLILITVTQVFLCIQVIRGSQRSRKIILALLSLSFVGTALSVSAGSAEGGNLYAVFIIMASHVFAMLEFTSDGAVNYTYNATAKNQARAQK